MISPSQLAHRPADTLDRLVCDALRASVSGQEPAARVRDDLLRAAAYHLQPIRFARLAARRRWRRSRLWRDVDPRPARAPGFGSAFLALESCRAKSTSVV